MRLHERCKGDDLGPGDDQRLVESAVAGDHDAWERIYRAIYPRLRAYAARRVGTHSADDVVSETMTRAVAGIGGFRWTNGGIDPWLFGIARRAAVDQLRKDGRAHRADTAGDAIVGPQPGDALEMADDHFATGTAFAQLAPADREVLELRVVAGLSAEQAAIVLGKRAGTIRTAQSRALVRLRKIMDQP